MKNAISLCVLLAATVAIATAQSITPGAYDTSSGNYPVSIKYTDKGNLIYKDYRGETEYIQTAPGRYTNTNSPTVHLFTTDGITLVHAEDDSSFRREFKLSAPANATPAEGVLAFSVNGDTYYANRATSSLFCGLYKYLGKEPRFFEYAEGEPIILLKEDQTGKYQRHGMRAITVKWWLESDYKGTLKVINGELADRYTLVIQFGPGNEYDIEGTFDRMNLDVYKDGSKVVILGERVKER